MKPTIYEAAGGHQAFVELARAWHARCLADPIVSHAFSHGYHPQHSERLAAYWAESLGGPADYTNSIGDQSAVVRLHSGNGEHVEMDERAQICFAQALDDVGLQRFTPAVDVEGLFSVGDRNHGRLSQVAAGCPGGPGSDSVVMGSAPC
jgi:truncated hemoglobin YjbI